jgi:hypothetical protein
MTFTSPEQPMNKSPALVSRLRRLIRRAGVRGLALAACVVVLALAAGLALSRRGKAPYEGKSVAALEQMLRSSDPTTQVQGAYGLSLKGAEARPTVPALMGLLHSPDPLVRQNVALALAKVGPAASEAVPDLMVALSDKEWTVRRQAALALGEIGPEARAAVDQLRKLRRDHQPYVRKAAEDALARIAPAAPPPGAR